MNIKEEIERMEKEYREKVNELIKGCDHVFNGMTAYSNNVMSMRCEKCGVPAGISIEKQNDFTLIFISSLHAWKTIPQIVFLYNTSTTDPHKLLLDFITAIKEKPFSTYDEHLPKIGITKL